VVDSREKALNLLSEAAGECLDKALAGVARHAKQDLAAAYLTRFEREHDPVDLLRALEVAEGFNRALAQEWLGLTKETIHSWNEVVRERSLWSTEARQHLQRLQRLPDPVRQWSPEEVSKAIERRDVDALTRIARAFPVETARFFERFGLRDRESARLLARALVETGEHYPETVVDAMGRTRDRESLAQGLMAFQSGDFPRAVTLLERAGNPLSLAARYYMAVKERSLHALEPALPDLRPEYRELSSRILMYHANLLEFEDRYLEAHADYERALAFANGDPTLTASILGRRGANFAMIGNADEAFRDAFRALHLLDRIADPNTRNTAYGSAAMAARQLGHPLIALHFQNAAVESVQRAIREKPEALSVVKLELVAALRARAEIHVELGRNVDAEGDLTQAADLAEAVEQPGYRDLFRMRIQEVRGQTLLTTRPAEAAVAFSEAIALAKIQDSTYRAMLHFKRAAARRKAGDLQADDDITTALDILRDEVRSAIVKSPERASEPLWTPYFSRFRDRYDALIESRMEAGDIEGAFVLAELVRAFEPMQILLQSGSVPPGFRPIETVAGLRQAQANLPADTVILQFLVLPQRTYTWVVTRERIFLVRQRATKANIEGWVADALAGVNSGQRDLFTRAMRAAYGELFREPLRQAGVSKTRIVIVPDGPMQGLPFSALAGARDEGHVIERASIATAGSTSLYLYALARDRQLSNDRNPSVLLIGDPAFDAGTFKRLPSAKEEVSELSRNYYPGAEVLTDTGATVQRFLLEARNATIIHFAGHALASPQAPWQSRLLFAGESGELSAKRLMQELPALERTRLVVLSACSSAGGASVGPQGLAPLVRPLIAAKVPAVVGSLWDVKDASAKDLLVFFHCHYRHGDDVAVALRKAQLEMLRNNEPAMKWAAFQAVGYAASPYASPIALEEPNHEHLCTENSLHRPDGLHSQ
jgi:CHAT domain-containing protein/tetratricopeptide (TPR) repeat protein